MEPKKNPKKVLNRISGLYFAIGLMLVLLLAIVALERKTYSPQIVLDVSMNDPDGIDDEIPPITLPNTPPPLPSPAPAQIIDDEKDIEETVIETSEPEDDVIYEFEEIEVNKEEEIAEVPFAVIEDVPVFPGSENAEDKRSCFNEMILKHIRKTFRYPEISQARGFRVKSI